MHIYQRSIKGFNIFYEEEDYILFYTILAVTARKYNIVVLELCMMINHVHILLADCNRAICSFMRDVFSIYACEFNQSCGRSGQLFHKSFGSAVKKDEKKIRTCINYIGNRLALSLGQSLQLGFVAMQNGTQQRELVHQLGLHRLGAALVGDAVCLEERVFIYRADQGVVAVAGGDDDVADTTLLEHGDYVERTFMVSVHMATKEVTEWK